MAATRRQHYAARRGLRVGGKPLLQATDWTQPRDPSRFPGSSAAWGGGWFCAQSADRPSADVPLRAFAPGEEQWRFVRKSWPHCWP